MAYEQTVAPNGAERLASDTDQVFVPFSGDHTIMGWYRALSVWSNGAFPTIFYWGDDPQTLYDDAVWIGWSPDNLRVSIFAKAASSALYSVVGGAQLDHHFAYVRNGTSNKLYIDGAERIDWTKDMSAFPAPTHMYLGTDSFAGDWHEHAMAHVREWDVALTESEINIEQQSAVAVKTANLITETPFQGDFFDRYQVAAGSLVLAGPAPTGVVA